jgi:hypothetical protein
MDPGNRLLSNDRRSSSPYQSRSLVALAHRRGVQSDNVRPSFERRCMHRLNRDQRIACRSAIGATVPPFWHEARAIIALKSDCRFLSIRIVVLSSLRSDLYNVSGYQCTRLHVSEFLERRGSRSAPSSLSFAGTCHVPTYALGNRKLNCILRTGQAVQTILR